MMAQAGLSTLMCFRTQVWQKNQFHNSITSSQTSVLYGVTEDSSSACPSDLRFLLCRRSLAGPTAWTFRFVRIHGVLPLSPSRLLLPFVLRGRFPLRRCCPDLSGAQPQSHHGVHSVFEEMDPTAVIPVGEGILAIRPPPHHGACG